MRSAPSRWRALGFLLTMAATAAALTACESVTWQRAETDEAQTLADLRSCRWEARLRAQHRLTYDPQLLVRGSAAPMGCPGTFSTGGPRLGDPSCRRGTPYVPQYAGASVAGTQAFLESDDTDECMHAKGYTLEPVTAAE